MNCLPNQSSLQASGPSPVVVTLITTEASVLTSSEVTSTASELPLEKTMHRQAEAMTDVLTQIMDRPLTPRFWGLNE